MQSFQKKFLLGDAYHCMATYHQMKKNYLQSIRLNNKAIKIFSKNKHTTR